MRKNFIAVVSQRHTSTGNTNKILIVSLSEVLIHTSHGIHRLQEIQDRKQGKAVCTL